MEYYLHIKPTFECLAKILKEEYLLEPQKTYSFLVTNQKLNLLFYPTNTQLTSLPFAFSFDKQNLISTKNTRIIEFPNNNYLIEVNPFLFEAKQNIGIKTKNVTFGGQNHTIYYSTHSKFNIKIECNNASKEYSLNTKIVDLATKTNKNNLLVYSKCEDTKHVILALEYDGEKYNYKNLEIVDLLEEENGNISTYKNLNDFAGHGVVTTYDLNKEVCMTSTLVYNTTPFLSRQKELIPYAFFEAVKVKNFKLASSYLSQELSKMLSPKHLQSFFGDFIQVSPPLSQNASFNEVALIYNQNNKFIAKNFFLQFDQDNKITNIQEV